MRVALSLVAVLLAACGSSGDQPAVDGGARDAAIDGAGQPDASPPVPRLVYVSDNDDSELAVIELGIDGMLTAMSALDVALPDSPTAMAYGRATGRLYVGLQAMGIATLDVGAGGAPSLQAMTTAGNNPTYIGLYEGESIIATAYFGADEIQTYDVSGAAPHPENATLGTAVQPHAAAAGPGGRIYVPHRDGEITRWFTINGDGDPVFAGELASGGDPIGPRHIAFTPDGAFAYVVNEHACTVSAHTVAGDGSLTRFETVPGIDSPQAGVDSGADIHVTPDGRFVYASFRGRDVLAMYSIGGDGSLTSLGTVDTEARPRELEVSPDGRFVLVCGQDSGFVQSLRVETDGTLTPVDRLEVGGDLRWAIID